MPGLVALAQREKVDFVVVGPEVPLALGLADRLAEAGIPAYGPKADGARLEASKTYTKEILLKYGIPTAASGVFSEVGGRARLPARAASPDRRQGRRPRRRQGRRRRPDARGGRGRGPRHARGRASSATGAARS